MIPLAGMCRLSLCSRRISAIISPMQIGRVKPASQLHASRVCFVYIKPILDPRKWQVSALCQTPPRNHPVVPFRLWRSYASRQPIWQATARFSKGRCAEDQKFFHALAISKNGTGSRARTYDLRFWRPPLYQLSYARIARCYFIKRTRTQVEFSGVAASGCNRRNPRASAQAHIRSSRAKVQCNMKLMTQGSSAIDKMEIEHVEVRDDAAEHIRRHHSRSAGPTVSYESTEYVASRKMSDQHRQTLFIAESVERRGGLWRIQEGLPRLALSRSAGACLRPYNLTGASA